MIHLPIPQCTLREDQTSMLSSVRECPSSADFVFTYTPSCFKPSRSPTLQYHNAKRIQALTAMLCKLTHPDVCSSHWWHVARFALVMILQGISLGKKISYIIECLGKHSSLQCQWSSHMALTGECFLINNAALQHWLKVSIKMSNYAQKAKNPERSQPVSQI